MLTLFWFFVSFSKCGCGPKTDTVSKSHASFFKNWQSKHFVVMGTKQTPFTKARPIFSKTDNPSILCEQVLIIQYEPRSESSRTFQNLVMHPKRTPYAKVKPFFWKLTIQVFGVRKCRFFHVNLVLNRCRLYEMWLWEKMNAVCKSYANFFKHRQSSCSCTHVPVLPCKPRSESLQAFRNVVMGLKQTPFAKARPIFSKTNNPRILCTQVPIIQHESRFESSRTF